MRKIAAIAAAVLGCSALPGISPAAQNGTFREDFSETQSAAVLPEGWLLWHRYSTYSALDSNLYLRSPDGVTQEITGNFVHAMNGSFGTSPEQIVFMAIDKAADEWDLFRYDGKTVTNLTPNSGFRNEDPKWSPDGRQIVFKRRRWDKTADDFVYDLALLDTESGAVELLTNDRAEQAMPCFSPDGNSLYYAEYADSVGRIRRMDLRTGTAKTIYAETGVNAYYPIAFGSKLYFTAWNSAENHCDRIMQYDGTAVTPVPFGSADCDCSDPCPAGSGMICSSTKNGSYDLYYFDGAQLLPLTACSSEQNDLGACFYPLPHGDINADGVYNAADVRALRDFLLAKPSAQLQKTDTGDLNRDSRLDAADLTLLKRAVPTN